MKRLSNFQTATQLRLLMRVHSRCRVNSFTPVQMSGDTINVAGRRAHLLDAKHQLSIANHVKVSILLFLGSDKSSIQGFGCA